MRYIIVFIIALITSVAGFGQQDSIVIDSNKVVQFSGIVTEGDSLYGVSGAIVMEKTTGRGTNTNLIGYFNLPVKVGDTIQIAALGYKMKTFTIPYDTVDSYNLIVRIEEDTITLPTINVFAFPSEEVFVELVLSMDLKNREEINNMEANLNSQILNRILVNSPIDGAAANKYYIEQQTQAYNRKYNVTTNPLLNPFAWARFIEDVKAYKKKKEEEKKEQKNNSSY